MIFIPAGIYVTSLHVEYGKGLLIRLTEIAIMGVFSAVIMGSVWLTFGVTEAVRNQIAASQRKSPAEEAAEAERVALELRTKAVNFSERGKELAQAGRAEEAEDAFLNAISHWQRLAARSPREAEFRQEQAKGQVGLGEAYSRTGHSKDAQAAYQEAIALWKELAAEFPAKPDYVRELARSQLGLGEVLLLSGGAQEAQPAFRDALILSAKLAVSSPGERHCRRDLARSYSDLGSAVAETGQAKEAEGELTKALDLWRQLVADFPGEAEYRHELAKCLVSLGNVFSKTDRRTNAEASYREALALSQPLARSAPANLEYRRDLARNNKQLGHLLYVIGRPKEAEAADRQAVALWKQLAADSTLPAENENDLAGTMVNLALVLRDRKELGEARALLEEAVPYHKRALKANPANQKYKLYFRNNCWAATEVFVDLGDHAASADAARELLRAAITPGQDSYHAARCLARCVPLANKDRQLPDQRRSQLTWGYGQEALAALKQAVEKGFRESGRKTEMHDLDSISEQARAHRERGEWLHRKGRIHYMFEAFNEAIGIWELLATAFPAVAAYREEIATTCLSQGRLVSVLDNMSAAEGNYRIAVTFFEKLAAEVPTKREYRKLISRCHYNLADLLRRNGRAKEAETAYRAALAIQEPMATDVHQQAFYRLELAKSQTGLGMLFAQTDRHKEGEAEMRKAQVMLKELAGERPSPRTDSQSVAQELARNHEALSNLLLETGRTKEAETQLRDAQSIRKLVADAVPAIPGFIQKFMGDVVPDTLECRQELANGYLSLGKLLQRTGRNSEALAAFHEGSAQLKKLADARPALPEDQRELVRSYNALGELLYRTGRPLEAETTYEEALAVEERCTSEFPDPPRLQNERAETMVKLALLLRDRKELRRAREMLEKALSVKGTSRHDEKYYESIRSDLHALGDILLGLGDHEAAAKVAWNLQIPFATAQDYYGSACLCARCIASAEKDRKLPEAKRRDQMQRYGYQALDALRQATYKGFKDVARMEKDPALASLRSRDDFRKLLAGLKEKR
ncbi:MAG TPA: tetratricopeptide repeat protein [Gemmataceae bacterium]|jgi:tetratricopeptide (TPR) repeat protein|nr:tetratricopeptide repeat protein [Gemmataceae bacterium]